MIGVNISVSFGSLLNLVKLLSHGTVESGDYDSLIEVDTAAALVGIDVRNWNLVSTSEKEIERCENFNFNDSEKVDLDETVEIKEEVNASGVYSALSKTVKVNKQRQRGPKRDLQLKCTECEKTFSEKGNFNRHALTHSGIKKFVCDECEMKFSRKDKLRLHKTLIHSGSRRESFRCDQCDKSFTRKDHIIRHKSNTHGMLDYL